MYYEMKAEAVSGPKAGSAITFRVNADSLADAMAKADRMVALEERNGHTFAPRDQWSVMQRESWVAA
jgi:hypothetical protein